MVRVQWLLRMTAIVACGALLVSMKLGCQPTSKAPVGVKIDSIINGAADLTQPAIGAMVIQRRSSFCTGTLITKQLVVTAAHCVDALNRYGLSRVQFRTDFADPNQKFTSEYHEIQQAAKHPQYRAGTGADYDIAVLVLKSKVTNAKIVPIAGNRNPMDSKWVGTNIRVVGYGLIQTQPNNRSADQKYAADIPLFRIGQRSFIHFDSQTPQGQRKSACHGDSGGPAIYTVGGKQYVMGVTSIAYQATPNGGQTLCDGGAVSTRLDTAMDFLRPFLTKYSDGPEACKTSTDCGACSQCNQKLICEPKEFPKTQEQCKPCKSDADCGTGICFRFPQGFRCLQACTAESCCPSGTTCNTLQGTTKSISACSPEKDACGEIPCQADGDCGPGEKCDSGKCAPNPPPRSPELCHPCKNNGDCSNGGVCYGPTGNGRCTQACGDGGFCPDGFRCSALYPGFPSQCVPDGGTCHVPCLQDKHCPTDFVCTNKFCSRKGGGIHGDTCDPTPCKEGLSCVPTASGKNCMRVCGIKPGFGGTSCPSNGQCQGGARCYRAGNFNVCLASCSSGGNECGAKGGGTCSSSGNCLCGEDKDCKNGFFCSIFTYTRSGPVGACIPRDADRPCGSGFECRSFESGRYCVPQGAGNRSIGESCDSLNRCKDGLVCLNTTSGLTCFEDCTQDRQCKLGGNCLQIGRSTRICLCQNNLGCPKDRVCETAFQGYGVCKPRRQGDPNGCIDDKECPQYFNCKERKCVKGTIPKPEPTTEPAQEPTPEPAPQDAGNQEPPPQPDTAPKPTPDTAKPAPDTAKPTPDTAKPAPDTNKPAPPGGGCGCDVSRQNNAPGQFPLSLLLLLGVFGLGFRRKK